MTTIARTAVCAAAGLIDVWRCEPTPFSGNRAPVPAHGGLARLPGRRS